jgi:hypothetical protein
MSSQNQINSNLDLNQIANWLQNLHSAPDWFRDPILRLNAAIDSNTLPLEKKEITLQGHPLQTLYHLVEKAVQNKQFPDLKRELMAVPEGLRENIFFEVWKQATDLGKGGKDWGQMHALDNFPRLLNVIKTVVEQRLDAQPAKTPIHGTIYRMGGQPQTYDWNWGETHAKEDTERLIRALHRHQHLEMIGKQIPVYTDLEKGIATPSRTFHLYRQELKEGQIGYHNGTGCSVDNARGDATRISNDLCHGFNIHCTYGATVDFQTDLSSALMGQKGVITPPVLQLLEEWQDFAEKNEGNNQRILQFCHSRGAVEVYNALRVAPEELRKRIIAVAIAPAYLIPPELAHKVVNLLIPSDAVSKIVTNRHLMDSPHTKILKDHSDGANPHDPHGSSYREILRPMVDRFIQTNDI